MRRGKGSRRIVVDGIEYRWRAAGADGCISLGTWPASDAGPYTGGSFRYHETWVEGRNGVWSSAGDQIVITNRLVRRVIEYARARHNYDPGSAGPELNLTNLDEVIVWADAVRASDTPT